MMRAAEKPITLAVALISSSSACITPSSAMHSAFERAESTLSVELPLARPTDDRFTLGPYSILDLRPKRPPSRSGESYSYVLALPADHPHEPAPEPTAVRQSTVLWNIVGVGAMGIRNQRATVSELVELRRPGHDDASWMLELFSGDEYQLIGELRSRDRSYDVDSVPMGRLLLGEDYGARLVCILRGDEIIAAVDLASSHARVLLKPGLPEEEQDVVLGAASAIALRSYMLGATGSALRYVMLDPRIFRQALAAASPLDCQGDLQCQIRRDDLIRLLNDPKHRKPTRTAQ